MIERYQVRYFLAVVETGSFSGAAAQVNVTQPTLSVAIAKLERTVGAKLFQRNSRRVNLTEAGARLLAHARAIEQEFSLAEAPQETAPRSSPFRIGVLPTIPASLLARLASVNSATPGAAPLEIVEGVARDLLGRLQRRRLDAALTLLRPDGDRFPSEPLFSEGYSLAAPSFHPLASQTVIAGELLANDAMIVRRHCEALPEASRYFTARGVRPRFSYRSTNDERTLSLVRAGLGVTVMPDGYEAEGVVRIKLAGFDHVRHIGVLFADEAAQQVAPEALKALRNPAEPPAARAARLS